MTCWNIRYVERMRQCQDGCHVQESVPHGIRGASCRNVQDMSDMRSLGEGVGDADTLLTVSCEVCLRKQYEKIYSPIYSVSRTMIVPVCQ